MQRDIITAAIEKLKSLLPEFESFELAGERYRQTELNYKHELSERFQELGQQLIQEDGNKLAPDFLGQFKNLLTKKLPNTELQNLTNWRDHAWMFDEVTADAKTGAELTALIRQLVVTADDPKAGKKGSEPFF